MKAPTLKAALENRNPQSPIPPWRVPTFKAALCNEFMKLTNAVSTELNELTPTKHLMKMAMVMMINDDIRNMLMCVCPISVFA